MKPVFDKWHYRAKAQLRTELPPLDLAFLSDECPDVLRRAQELRGKAMARQMKNPEFNRWLVETEHVAH